MITVAITAAAIVVALVAVAAAVSEHLRRRALADELDALGKRCDGNEDFLLDVVRLASRVEVERKYLARRHPETAAELDAKLAALKAAGKIE